MNTEKGIRPNIKIAEKKLQEFGKVISDWRLDIAMLLIIAGSVGGAYGFLKLTQVNPPKMVADMTQSFPEYNQKKFEADQQIIQSFNANAVIGDTSINIPKNVIQAEAYIRNNQDIFNKDVAIEQAAGDKQTVDLFGGISGVGGAIMICYLVPPINDERKQRQKQKSVSEKEPLS